MHRFEAVTSFYDEYYDTVMMVPAAAAELSTDDVRIDASLHVESRWATQQEARHLLPWPSSRDAIDGIVEAVLGDGRACVPMAMPQVSG